MLVLITLVITNVQIVNKELQPGCNLKWPIDVFFKTLRKYSHIWVLHYPEKDLQAELLYLSSWGIDPD